MVPVIYPKTKKINKQGEVANKGWGLTKSLMVDDVPSNLNSIPEYRTADIALNISNFESFICWDGM